MTLDTYTLAIFGAGSLAGAGLIIEVCLLPEIISASRLIRFYLRTRDRQRAVRLWQVDELARHHRQSADRT